jgi:hypothetical protein
LVTVVFTGDNITMPFARAMVFGDLSGSRGGSCHGRDLEVGVAADTEEPKMSTHAAVARERSGVACGGEEIPREKEKEI